jgi:RNA polymerase sigma-B factor
MTLNPDKEKKIQDLFIKYAETKDTEIRNQLVEQYLYIVEILIKKYLNKGIDYDDLYQVASMALVYAVERFDPSKGFRFSSFATPTIIGEIKRYFRDKGWAIKVPRKLKELSMQLQNAKEDLRVKLGHAPTIPELSEYMGHSEEEILDAMESGRSYATYSLNQAFDDDSDGDGVKLENYTSVNEAGYTSFENADLIKSVFKELSDNEKTIFDGRLLHEKTQQEVAEALGVSQMTVSRMENDIKRKFREEFHKENR